MISIIQRQNINFTSTPIHNVNLRKVTNGKEDGFISAVFSKLNLGDTEDKTALWHIQNTWDESEKKSKAVANTICKHFLAKKQERQADYFCLELENKESLGNRIIGLMELQPEKHDSKDVLYLSLLTTKPDFIHKKENRTIKGIGEILVGEAINQAKKGNHSRLDIWAEDKGFFARIFEKTKIDLEKILTRSNRDWDEYEIKREHFQQYLKECEKNYKTNFSEII